MNNMAKQTGASSLSVIVFLAMAMVILTIAFKLYPVFYEHWQIQNIVESFHDETDLKELPVKEISRRFETRLLTNNVRDFNFKDSVKITTIDGTLKIVVDYEVRVPIYKNIDAIVSFDESLEKAL